MSQETSQHCAWCLVDPCTCDHQHLLAPFLRPAPLTAEEENLRRHQALEQVRLTARAEGAAEERRLAEQFLRRRGAEAAKAAEERRRRNGGRQDELREDGLSWASDAHLADADAIRDGAHLADGPGVCPVRVEADESSAYLMIGDMPLFGSAGNMVQFPISIAFGRGADDRPVPLRVADHRARLEELAARLRRALGWR